MFQSIAKLNLVLFTGFLIVGLHCISAQEIRIDLGPDQIAANQLFTISINITDGKLESYEGFPEIQGFSKKGTSSSSTTNFINGKVSSSQSITQNYLPLGQGTFTIPPFTIMVNGERVSSRGKTVVVSAPAQRQQQRPDPYGTDPFQDLFGRQSAPQEFVDVESDAFLGVSTDKEEVYLGEGFTVTLAFYVAESNKAELRFYELGRQLSEIMKSIKPTNCWEENFNIDNVSGESIMLGNKRYNHYKIFQATYYPLNVQDIDIPKVGLELIKYQVAKNPTFFGQNRKEDYEKFFSKPKTIKVKDLPPHPLKDKVSVGVFTKGEKIASTQLETGASFNYAFEILGEGNISAIAEPEIKTGKAFDFYPPNITQDITRSGGKVRGKKSFNYYGIPNEPGDYDMKRLVNWVFFNTQAKKYDTLKSDLVFKVTGESKKNESIQATDVGSFYDIMEFTDNTIRQSNNESYLKLFVNIFIILLLALTAYMIYRK
jgi:hypothetical protein